MVKPPGVCVHGGVLGVGIVLSASGGSGVGGLGSE